MGRICLQCSSTFVPFALSASVKKVDTMPMFRFTTLVTIVTITALFSRQECVAADRDLIPPEVLKQMDPDILSGKRPIFATIRQADIFGLRTKPRRNADFVKFDFDPSKLSSVQRAIIEKWIRSGANDVYFSDVAIMKYSAFVAPLELYSAHVFSGQTVLIARGVHTDHKVNTDCKTSMTQLPPCSQPAKVLPSNRLANASCSDSESVSVRVKRAFTTECFSGPGAYLR
jgi:hypothetical protein